MFKIRKNVHAESSPAAVQATDSPKFRELTRNANPQCVLELRAFVREVGSDTVATLRRMWYIGRHVTQLHRPEMSRPRQGSEAIDAVAIASALSPGYSVSYLGKMARFYRLFATESEREWLLGLRTKGSDSPLTWAHVEILLGGINGETADRSRFQQMLNDVLENDLSPEALYQAYTRASQLQGKANKPSANMGRPLSVPPTFDGRCSRLEKQVEVFVRNTEQIYLSDSYGFSATIRDMAQEQVSRKQLELRAAVDRDRSLLEQQKELTERLLTELTEVEEYIDYCVKAETEATGVAEAAALEASDAGR